MAKIIKPLTDAQCAAAKPKEKEYPLFHGKGLLLLVRPTGTKTWRYRYKNLPHVYYTTTSGTQTITLGTYPSLTLKQAQAKRDLFNSQIANGIDPKAKMAADTLAVQQGRTLASIMNEYIEKEAITHKGHKYEKLRLEKIMRDFPTICGKVITEVNQLDMIAFRNERFKQVQGTSVNREMKLLGSVFSYAMKELRLLDVSPLSNVKKPTPNPHRDRRITEDEIEALLLVTGYKRGMKPVMIKHQAMWCFLFAIETAMRASEITGMTWENVHDDYILLTNTKNGHSRRVPLGNAALELLSVVRGVGAERVLLITSETLDANFRKYRNKTDIKDLHFHDTRHEATTRLAQKMPIHDLAKITGHRDLKMLMGYYNPTTTELAEKINGDNIIKFKTA